MHNPPAKQPNEQNHFARMRWIARQTLIGRPELRCLALVTILYGTVSYIPVWMITLYAIKNGVPTDWVGVVWAGSNYCVAIGSALSHPMGARLGLRPTLVSCIALIATGYLGLALTHHPYGVMFYFAITLMRGIHIPLLHHLEQQLIPSSDRASFVSFRSLLFRSGYVVLGPTIGLCVDHYGEHAVFGGLCLILTVACALALRWLIRANVEQAAAKPPEA